MYSSNIMLSMAIQSKKMQVEQTGRKWCTDKCLPVNSEKNR